MAMASTWPTTSPDRKLVGLPGTEQPLVWETPQLALDHIEEFLTGARHGQDPSRVPATVLFTDIVGSTQQARRLGDRRWCELLNVHDELARRRNWRYSGRPPSPVPPPVMAA